MRCILSFLLLAVVHVSLAQETPFGSIRVKVLDAETDQPIPYANVYINQTTIGGYTDDQGEVEVKRIPFGKHLLIISELGHKMLQRNLTINGDRLYLTVKLLPRVLDGVTVRARRDDKWHRQLARFERLFFGSDRYQDCTIKNSWALEFKNLQGDFVAEADEPLQIENRFLGYNLDFHITRCFFNATNFTITGIVRFEEMQGDDALMDQWKKNREQAYVGSPQHFLKAVIGGTATNRGYDLYRDITGSESIIRESTLFKAIGKSIMPDSIGRMRSVSDGIYEIEFPDRLEVHYTRKRAKPVAYLDIRHAVSWMEVKKGTLIVSRNGIVQDYENLVVGGMMSDLKVGEWLPLDYQYADPNDYVPVVVPPEKRLALLEKPYVQTDRDYYYNGESMWFKGYMSYAVPMLKDTLSQSIYVELADAAGKIVSSKRYYVEEGKFNGDILLDRNLKPGPYQLKAYTAWMLNFDTRLIFTKTITILDEREAVRIATGYNVSKDSLANIVLATDKQSYLPREKVIVTLDVLDTLGFSTSSNLSISVTDVDQAVPHQNEKTILTNYLYDYIESGDSTLVKYDIEYGIAFDGRFWLGKKPAQASITVFQENSKEAFAIITEEDGMFQRSLMFYDTVSFYINALSANNKKGRVVMDTLRPRSPHLELEPLSLDIFSASTVQRSALNLTGTTLLQEVSIKSTRIERPKPAVIHGHGDYTVTGDWINDHNFTDPLLAMASKVPGLIYNAATGALHLNTGFTSYNGAQPPLLLVDGVEVPLDAVRDVPVRSIDFIDVLKFGSTASYGSRGANGVVAIYTKKWTPGDANDLSFDKRKLQEVKWSGFSTATTFTAPDYSKPSDSDYFDNRATIFWSPSVITTGKEPATVSFYAADAATKYRVVVEGVTAAGVPVRAEKVIEVVNGR